MHSFSKLFFLITSLIIVFLNGNIALAATTCTNPNGAIGSLSMVGGVLQRCTANGWGNIAGAGDAPGNNCSTLGLTSYDSTTGAPLYCNNDSPQKHWAAVSSASSNPWYCLCTKSNLNWDASVSKSDISNQLCWLTPPYTSYWACKQVDLNKPWACKCNNGFGAFYYGPVNFAIDMSPYVCYAWKGLQNHWYCTQTP